LNSHENTFCSGSTAGNLMSTEAMDAIAHKYTGKPLQLAANTLRGLSTAEFGQNEP